MKTKTATFVILAVLGAAGTWMFAMPVDAMTGETFDASETAVLPVAAIPLEAITSMKRQRQFTGVAVAARRSSLAFERTARLLQVLVDEGQRVEATQVLAILDQRHLEARMDQLNADVAQQTAVLEELTSGPRQELIASTRAELAALTADEELSQATFQRADKLFERNATSIQQLDEARLSWKSAAARTAAMQKRLEELQTGTRQERIDAQRAVVASLEAQRRQLQYDLDDSQLKAPFSGIVVRRMADEGDMLNPQQPVLELLETTKMEARIGVPSALVGQLDRDGYHVLTTDALSVTGRIRDVIAQIDPATRTQTVVLDIDAEHCESLADGQLIRLNFQETQPVQGFRVPLTALANASRGLWSVYVVETANRSSNSESETEAEMQFPVIRARTVEVLHSDGQYAVIRGTIYAGEQIVANGVHRVSPDQHVRLVQAESPESASASNNR